MTNPNPPNTLDEPNESESDRNIKLGTSIQKELSSISPTKPDISELDKIFNRLADKLGIPRDSYSLEYAKDSAATLITNKQLEELNFILKNASGGGSWRRVIIGRIAELTKKVSKNE